MVVHEAVSEVIKERGMRGGGSGGPEIVHGLHEPTPEEMMPDTIDKDSACEGIARLSELLR